jgi:trigger factor
MQTAVETLPEDRVRLTVEVPAHDVDHAFEHALRDLAKDVRIPGFRKGKVPTRVVLARLGPEAVTEEALRTHLGSWYSRAVSEARIEPVDQPDIDWADPPHEGAPFNFTATVQVAPAAELPEDLVIEAPREPIEIPSDAVDRELERLRAAAAELAPLDGDVPAAAGHFALVDFTGRLDGKVLKDASVTDYQVEIGSGRLVKELDAALPGMKVGETREIEVTFPADYEPKRVAGRTAQFELTLKELKEAVLPELDDAFAAQVSEHDTLADLRASVEAELAKALEQVAEGRFRGAVMATLGEQARVEVPPAMVDRRVRDRLEDLARRLSRQGVPLDAYLRAAGRTIEQAVQELRPEAAKEVREELALRAYADREEIRVSDEELEAFIRDEATETKEDADRAVERLIGAPAGEELREDLRLRAALDHAVANAKAITPEQAEAREKLWTPGRDAEKAEGARSAIWTPPTAQ